MGSLYILDSNSLSGVWLVRIFSYCMPSSPADWQSPLQYRSFLISYGPLDCWSCFLDNQAPIQKVFTRSVHSYFLLEVSDIRFNVEIFKTFEIDLCAGWERRIKFHSACRDSPPPGPFKDVIFSLIIFFGTCIKIQVAVGTGTYIWVLESMPLIKVSVFVPVWCCLTTMMVQCKLKPEETPPWNLLSRQPC